MLGAFAGSSAIGEWRDYMLWRNGTDFGTTDPWFDKDISFYVFTLPWLHYLVDFAMAVLVVALIAAVVVHYLYGGIRLQATRDRLSGAAQVQVSVLLGLFVLVKALDYYLDRFDLVHKSGSLITGMDYTADNAILPAKNILLGIAVICAILFFVNVWRRTWLLPSVGLALLAVSAILLGLIWPGIVQQFQVKPSEADKEAPYIQANIDATLAAYDVGKDKVEVEKFSDSTVDEPPVTLNAKTSSIPLVDPKLVRQTFEQNQQERAYYSVADVLDVDRYQIGGIDRALVLGVREMDQSGIDPGDRNWSNLHTVYTHGSGVIAAYANQRTEANRVPSVNDDDKTQWAEGQGAGEDALTTTTGGFKQQVYFGELSPDYSVVGKSSKDSKSVELDLGSSDASGESTDVTTTYDGKGGVPVGSTFRQLMYAVKFGEPNFLLSGRVNANSEVIYNRDPTTRVRKFAPWLSVDSDPYPTVVNGRIVWVLDGYTTTNNYPGAERESFKKMVDDSLQDQNELRTLPTDEINYMRNAVKATVDAYDGTVTLYEWDDSDPILKTWEKAFPGTVQPKADIPEELHGAPALPRGHVQGPALPVRALPRHRPGALVQRQQPLGRPGGPELPESPAAAVPRLRGRAGRRPGGLLADVDVRALQQEQPRGLRVRRLRRDVGGLREDQGPAAHRPERQGPRADRQRLHLRHRRRRPVGPVQPQRGPGHLRQPAHPADRRRADLCRAGVRRTPGLDGELPEPGVRAGLVQR